MSAGETIGTHVERLGDAAEELADSAPIGWAARLGLTARGVVYLVMGALGVLISIGARSGRADQKGVLAEVVGKPYGTVMVAALAVGFAGYALWRFTEAAVGVAGEGRRAGPRLQSLARGVAYAVVCWTALSVLRGSRTSQGSQETSLVSRVLGYDHGRVWVAAAGVAVIAVAGVLVLEGVRATFMRYFPGVGMRARHLVRRLGQVGTVSRGVVFGLAGVLLVVAAWRYEPSRASGTDGALRTLLAQPYGRVLGLLASAGLVAFGLYGLAEARYRRVR